MFLLNSQIPQIASSASQSFSRSYRSSLPNSLTHVAPFTPGSRPGDPLRFRYGPAARARVFSRATHTQRPRAASPDDPSAAQQPDTDHYPDEDRVSPCAPRPHAHRVAAGRRGSRILTRSSFDQMPPLSAPAHSARSSLPQKPSSMVLGIPSESLLLPPRSAPPPAPPRAAPGLLHTQRAPLPLGHRCGLHRHPFSEQPNSVGTL